MQLFAPEIDRILERIDMFQSLMDQYVKEQLLSMYQEISCIDPAENDEVRRIWLEFPRGTIRNFGQFREYKKEGIVNTREEFMEMWKDYYPNETYWYSLTTARYESKLFFYFNSKLAFTLDSKEESKTIDNQWSEYLKNFLDKFASRLKEDISRFRQDPEACKNYLEKHLAYSKRFGRIKRLDFWNILGDEAIRLDERIGIRGIEKLREFISATGEPGYSSPSQNVTADDYFRYCEICYDANSYFKGEKQRLSPRDKYTSMADGRDAGLREIIGNSIKAFHEWYYGGDRMGSHPWEICRGGNSTHISLSLYPRGDQWILHLAGSSFVRVEETVRMALALYERHIPFILADAEEIERMVTGVDFIGIVPDYVFPRYCHSLFPKEERIIDFMNLDREFEDQIVPVATWYPVEMIYE